MSYAIIRVGGKQYRVQEGERLLVDRLGADEGKTFTPDLLFVPDGDGKGVTVTAKVVEHVKGDKIRIGKYRKRTGYKRHTGFRASLTQIEIQSIGTGKAAPKAAAKAEAPKTEAPKVETPKVETPRAEAAPKAAKPKAAAKAAPKAAGPAEPPKGYAEMTVAQVSEGAKSWDRGALEAALAYEQANAKRKGALSALESALAKTED